MITEGTNVNSETVNLPPPTNPYEVRLISFSKDGKRAEVVVIRWTRGGKKTSETKHLRWNPEFPGGLSDVDGNVYKV